MEIEARRRPRVRPGRLIQVTCLDQAMAHSGTLVDISETGMGISLDAPLAAGTTIHVELEDHLLVGTVVHCNELPNQEFRVGLQLVNRIGGPAWEVLLRKWQQRPALPNPVASESLSREV